MGLEGDAEGSRHEQMVRALPADKVARAEALHTRMEAGERLSRAERTEMTVLERELAGAAAGELRRRLRASRSRPR
jgi:hypothetical protein